MSAPVNPEIVASTERRARAEAVVIPEPVVPEPIVPAPVVPEPVVPEPKVRKRGSR